MKVNKVMGIHGNYRVHVISCYFQSLSLIKYLILVGGASSQEKETGCSWLVDWFDSLITNAAGHFWEARLRLGWGRMGVSVGAVHRFSWFAAQRFPFASSVCTASFTLCFLYYRSRRAEMNQQQSDSPSGFYCSFQTPLSFLLSAVKIWRKTVIPDSSTQLLQSCFH